MKKEGEMKGVGVSTGRGRLRMGGKDAAQLGDPLREGGVIKTAGRA